MPHKDKSMKKSRSFSAHAKKTEAASKAKRKTAKTPVTPKPRSAVIQKKTAAKPTKKVTGKQLSNLAAADQSARPKAQLLNSVVTYEGPLFRVQRDTLIEPNGRKSIRDVIRHNGSVVILAIDATKSKRDPWIVMERQYRHAANQYLWELPAGKLNVGEDPLAGAQREMEEETGYRARKWKLQVEYFASPGFLGESMKVFLAEGLIAGEAHPEADEQIEFRLVKLSEVLKAIDKGAIIDGKTLTSVQLFARQLSRKLAHKHKK